MEHVPGHIFFVHDHSVPLQVLQKSILILIIHYIKSMFFRYAFVAYVAKTQKYQKCKI